MKKTISQEKINSEARINRVNTISRNNHIKECICDELGKIMYLDTEVFGDKSGERVKIVIDLGDNKNEFVFRDHFYNFNELDKNGKEKSIQNKAKDILRRILSTI